MKKGDLVRYVGTIGRVVEHGYLWLVVMPFAQDDNYWLCQSLATGEQLFLLKSNLRKHDDEEG